ncbi:hypothetical protein ACHAW5_011267 [Stephanodiscus triporus]|uniref:Lon N-terminal domain-containing protein n=1 Tax=Stephanodiscus triporus TaxID=2934178 RepID=A0ABD3MJ73_9STRA
MASAHVVIVASVALLASSSSSSFLFPRSCRWGSADGTTPPPPRLLAPSGRRTTTTTTRPSSNVGDGDDNDDDDAGKAGVGDLEGDRMDIVRMLQRSYYHDDRPFVVDGGGDDDVRGGGVATANPSRRPRLDASSGRIGNLPLWRVGWVETPGRRNCLNVHEMQYTHMFETILSRSKTSTAPDDDDDGPPYFGHLYLPGGTSSARSGDGRYRLRTWREELADSDRFDDHGTSSTLADPNVRTPTVDRSAVVGCLMRVVDHARMDDGRLIVLVEALERFVVEEIVDTRPYAVANVQILLDEEELPWETRDDGKRASDEGARGRLRTRDDKNACAFLRGKAVAASFRYHEYEFDGRKLPLSSGGGDGKSYLTKDDVPWLEISRLLPFACYSSDDRCLASANKMSARIIEDATTMTARIYDDRGSAPVVPSARGELPMERELRNGGILWEPPRMSSAVVVGRRRDDLDCDALETLIWIALDDFCRGTGFVLPEEVRRLMPPEMDYLDITTTDKRHSSPLSREYPKLRRQRRLSYLAPALIENLELPMKGMRQAWLNAPSTAARLLGALERYEYLTNKMMGEFE